jgi:dTDP-glucose pyrophosphorylase/CBS domain-containing protein
MKNWQNTIINHKSSIRDVIETIDRSALQIALVVDDDAKLVGTVTDGDVRRGILRGLSLDDSVDKIMFRDFIFARDTDSTEKILDLMRSKEIRHIPVLDVQGRIKDLKVLIELIKTGRYDNIVVIMAGGLGTRLRPLTESCPKPMLKVGQKPILETIIEHFKRQGFWRFYLAVNYKSHIIENYFQDGQRWNVQIEYIRENKRMGTVGALSLLPSMPDKPLIVMNGDILTNVNFPQLLDFYAQTEAKATMCVREYDFQVPYGVIQVQGHYLQDIQEKPVHSFFVNAGIYVLSPDVLSMIPANSYYDITMLFENMLIKKMPISVFPIREYWIDIGRLPDYERANGEFNNYFREENDAK